MANKSKFTRLHALIFQEERLLVLRKQDEAFFHLPYVDVTGPFHERKLAKGIAETYKAQGKVVRKLPHLAFIHDGEQISVEAYVYQTPLFTSLDGYEVALIEENSPIREKLDPESAYLARRYFIYAPAYENRPRTIALLPEDQPRIHHLVGCLRYFQGRVPSGEREEFEELVNSASSIRRMNEAFSIICNTHRANPRKYVEYLKKEEEERKAAEAKKKARHKR